MRSKRVKLGRRRGWENKGASRRIEFAVRNAKAIASENTSRCGVIEAVMMQRVTLRVQRLQLAAVEIKPLFVISDYATRFFHRLNNAIHRARLFDAVNRLCASDQFCRINHVSGATRMNDTAGIGQLLHQEARSASMVQVNMRKENVVNITHVEVLLMQRIDEQRHAVVGSGIDEGRAAAFNNQVAGVLQGSRILSIDGRDAIVKLGRLSAVTGQRID